MTDSRASSIEDYQDHITHKDGFSLEEDFMDTLDVALEAGDRAGFEDRFMPLQPSTKAEVLKRLSPEDRDAVLDTYAHLFPPEMFTYLEGDLQEYVLTRLPNDLLALAVQTLDSDDALDLVITLSESDRFEVIRKLNREMRAALEEGLSFPEDSAGRLMQREFVACPQFWTVGKTIDFIRANTEDLPSDFLDIIVVTPGYKVIGEIPLHKLVRAGRDDKLEELTADQLHTIPAKLDQEEVAYIFRNEGLGSAPVVDPSGRLIGVITVDDVLDVISEEAEEDILRLAGLEEGDFYKAIFNTSVSRFKWLSINLLTAIIASLVIGLFDATIEQVVALAILMPIVASMGGNAGTQSLTVAVRALSTKDLSEGNMIRTIWKETLVGFLNGAAFAILTGFVVLLWFGNPVLGIVIASAMIINLIVAGFCGAGIPIALNRMGADPAISSTVFLTTVTDVIGFFAFLGLAAIFLI